LILAIKDARDRENVTAAGFRPPLDPPYPGPPHSVILSVAEGSQLSQSAFFGVF
jgi:hypothetical protein